ncbi:MAG TPA: cytochrome c [Deltaproteobacteria bacterium]|nr:cytochrome c [Deltaproteobacteria bacterium]
MRKAIIAAVAAAGLAFSGAAIAADGAKIYKSKCQACHGKGGKGTPMAPAFKGNDFIKGDAAAIKDVILHGRKGAAKKYKKYPIDMPAQKLSDADADAVVKYLKSL